MARQDLSREELFALVWEKPTSEIAKERGVSDVAISKLCSRLQVPKPPRGYWARVQSGQTPRLPPLAAFRDELDRKRREAVRVRAAGVLSILQQQFFRAALSDLRARGIDVGDANARGSRLPDLKPDIATQILLLIENRAHDWVKDGKVAANWSHSVQASATSLVGKILPYARPQLLIFEQERKKGAPESGPVVFVRLTAQLQERIASLAGIVRDQKLRHLVMPLMSADHAWTVRHLYSPDSRDSFDSVLCVSTNEVWVECTRPSWRDDAPPERITTGKLKLQDVMPIDYMAVRHIALPPVISKATEAPYRERLRGLIETERVYDLMSRAAYSMKQDVPGEMLALADRIWFGKARPFWSARDAWTRLEQELEQWETELEAERSALAQSILGISIGDIVAAQSGATLLRLSVTGMTVYTDDKHVTFLVTGTRFRKDGTLGKVADTLRLYFEA
ncbi:hypothetical protein RA307_31780 [Xanthobacteraceae bacterium Astr-EGSB]|uniref:hypothetical protein n=1 Tax=Astrobacterium formosum TaxID=3069710 RepID=UPI0027B1DB13|nr:hypothetical protein [Xanthobacteraceae bacterium Astr-EGSB]